MTLISKTHYLVIIVSLLIASCSNDSILQVKFKGEHYTGIKAIKTLTKPEIIKGYETMANKPGYQQAGLFTHNVISNVEVKQIEYQTSLGGDRLVASGLLCYPSKPGSYPIICFQNGTNVLHVEAPTENPDNELFTLLESIASMGFIVVIPDYPGFGSSNHKVHPYLIKDETVQSSEDLLLATREYLSKEVNETTSNDQLYLMGYSQGAWATLQLQHKIEQEGFGSFELVGSSCGAGPYSISDLFMAKLTNELTTEIPQPYFFAYMMNAYKEYEMLGTLELKDIFNEPYASNIPGLFNGRNSSSVINDSLSTDISKLINKEYLEGITNINSKYLPVRKSYAHNDIHAWQIKTPTWLFHGSTDKVVPPVVTADMVKSFRMAGSSDHILKECILLGLGHTQAVIPYGLSTIENFLQLEKQQ